MTREFHVINYFYITIDLLSSSYGILPLTSTWGHPASAFFNIPITSAFSPSIWKWFNTNSESFLSTIKTAPIPQLKTLNISSEVTFPSYANQPNTSGIIHEWASSIHEMFEGNTRGILSFNPPPKTGNFGEMKEYYFHLTSRKKLRVKYIYVSKKTWMNFFCDKR